MAAKRSVLELPELDGQPPEKKAKVQVIDLTDEPDSDPPAPPVPNHDEESSATDEEDDHTIDDNAIDDATESDLDDDSNSDSQLPYIESSSSDSDSDANNIPEPSIIANANDALAERKGLFQNVRGDGPQKMPEGSRQYAATEMVLDMAEHTFNLEVVEIIHLGDHVLKHGYDCCHDVAPPQDSVFKCADCGMVAETIPHEWNEDTDTLESKSTRFSKLIQTFLAKPIVLSSIS